MKNNSDFENKDAEEQELPELQEQPDASSNGEGDGKKNKQPKIVASIIGSLNTIKNDLEDALSETEEQAEEENAKIFSDDAPEPTLITVDSESMRERKIRRRTVVFGTVITVFALFGLFSAVWQTYRAVKPIADGTNFRNRVLEGILPLAITNPPPFQDTEELSNYTAVSAAVWSIAIFSDFEYYDKESEPGRVLIPAADVEYSAKKLFGTDFEITHITVEDVSLSFVYYEETNSYSIPEIPQFISYKPEVAEARRVKINNVNYWEVEVLYYAPTPLEFSNSKYKKTPVKTLVFTVREMNYGFTVYSVSNPDY